MAGATAALVCQTQDHPLPQFSSALPSLARTKTWNSFYTKHFSTPKGFHLIPRSYFGVGTKEDVKDLNTEVKNTITDIQPLVLDLEDECSVTNFREGNFDKCEEILETHFSDSEVLVNTQRDRGTGSNSSEPRAVFHGKTWARIRENRIKSPVCSSPSGRDGSLAVTARLFAHRSRSLDLGSQETVELFGSNSGINVPQIPNVPQYSSIESDLKPHSSALGSERVSVQLLSHSSPLKDLPQSPGETKPDVNFCVKAKDTIFLEPKLPSISLSTNPPSQELFTKTISFDRQNTTDLKDLISNIDLSSTETVEVKVECPVRSAERRSGDPVREYEAVVATTNQESRTYETLLHLSQTLTSTMGIRISHPQTTGCATIVAPVSRKNRHLEHQEISEEGSGGLPERVIQSSWISKRRERSRDLLRAVAVQTEAVLEEELDWDLSDRQDRETQTLPPNPTAFQRNRTDAMVQTDYRYFPLAATDADRPHQEPVLRKTYRDAGTQTERTTASVSTQTEVEFLLLSSSHPQSAIADAGPAPADMAASAPGPPADVGHVREGSSVIRITPYKGRDAGTSSSGRHKADRRSSSVESSSPTTAAAYSPTSLPSLMKQGAISAASSPSLIVPADVTAPLRAPSDTSSASLRPRKDSMALWESLGPFYLNELLPVVKAGQKFYRKRRKMIDVSVQTEMNAVDEAPEFAPRPPPCRKKELLRNLDLGELDQHALSTTREQAASLQSLVAHLCPPDFNDLQKVRAIFRWLAGNVRYDWKFVEKVQTAEQVLQTRAGVSKDFVQLLVALCERASVRARRLQGFARSREFRVGRRFDPERDVFHYWAAVFLFDSWRFVDPTYGAGYTDAQGRYHAALQDHYFLPDPDTFVYTHYPHHPDDPTYYRWQLMDVPVSLDLFNCFPCITPHFWACGLRLRRQRTSPVIFSQQAELQLAASVYVRYKFTFYPADESESEEMNRWVFCCLKEGGAVVSFFMSPPTTAPLVLRISAQPEDDLETDDTPLEHVVSFLILCTKPRKYFVPYPPHDGVWGANPRMYQCGLDLVSESGPALISWGGRKHLTFEKAFDVLLMFQLFDKDGNSVDLKGVLKKDETEDEIHVSIVPPGMGFFKLMLFGIPRPEARGRWRLPLLAVYLLESKMNVSPYSKRETTSKKKERIKLKVRAR